MPAVERIIADDTFLLSMEASSQYAAAVSKSITGSTVSTVHVDSVVGSGYAGSFFAGPLSSGKRTFVAVVTDEDAVVYRLEGVLSDSLNGLSVVSQTATPLTGAWNQGFPHYFGLVATNTTLSGTIDGVSWSSTTGFTLSIGGQILLRPSVVPEISTAKVYTCRTFAGSSISFLPFPSGVTPVTDGSGSQGSWAAPERRLFQGNAFDRMGITDTNTLVSAGTATAYGTTPNAVAPSSKNSLRWWPLLYTAPVPGTSSLKGYAPSAAVAFSPSVFSVGYNPDAGNIASVTYSSQPHVHGIISAYFGDLDFDVGKTVPWAKHFVDDLFIADINSGDPRYWVIDWVKSFPGSKTMTLGVDYFTNPVAWRKAQFAAADAAWNYSDDDWVLFLDSSEAISCDTSSTPDDVVVNPFRSYIHREVQRCVDIGASFACIPWYAFVRNDSVPDSRRFLQITDNALLQDQGVVLPTDPSNVAVLPVAAPYYHQPSNFTERGLVRLVKVSALRSATFNWTRLDVLSQPDAGVKVQVISYAYAKWVNPATSTNDGLKMRQKISQVRPLVGLPSSGSGDASGDAGPYTVAVNGVLTPVAATTTQTAPLLTPMYSAYFRRNPRDGVWYKKGVSGPEVPDPPYAFSYPPPTGLALASNATVKVN